MLGISDLCSGNVLFLEKLYNSVSQSKTFPGLIHQTLILYSCQQYFQKRNN